jgi:hypothetical protein
VGKKIAFLRIIGSGIILLTLHGGRVYGQDSKLTMMIAVGTKGHARESACRGCVDKHVFRGAVLAFEAGGFGVRP